MTKKLQGMLEFVDEFHEERHVLYNIKRILDYCDINRMSWKEYKAYEELKDYLEENGVSVDRDETEELLKDIQELCDGCIFLEVGKNLLFNCRKNNILYDIPEGYKCRDKMKHAVIE